MKRNMSKEKNPKLKSLEKREKRKRRRAQKPR